MYATKLLHLGDGSGARKQPDVHATYCTVHTLSETVVSTSRRPCRVPRLGQFHRDLLGLLAGVFILCAVVAVATLLIAWLWSWIF